MAAGDDWDLVEKNIEEIKKGRVSFDPEKKVCTRQKLVKRFAYGCAGEERKKSGFASRISAHTGRQLSKRAENGLEELDNQKKKTVRKWADGDCRSSKHEP